MLNAIATMRTRSWLILVLAFFMSDFDRLPNHRTSDACASRQRAGIESL
jgi:hypothetical protein